MRKYGVQEHPPSFYRKLFYQICNILGLRGGRGIPLTDLGDWVNRGKA